MSDLRWEDLAESVRFDEVLDALGIVVTDVTNTGWHQASCPLDSHPGADATPSFGVNEHELCYNCFTCGEGGFLPKLVIRLEHLEDEEDDSAWQKSLRWLLPYTDLTSDVDRQFVESIERQLRGDGRAPKRQRHLTLPQLSDKTLMTLRIAPVSLLAKWGIKGEDTVEAFNIRYDSERLRFGKDDEHYNGPALIIPHYYEEKLVGYQERWLEDPPKWIPKYTNSRDFPKKETLFNWDRTLRFARKGEVTIVVESAMTVIRLSELGYSSVATFSAQVSETQYRLLTSLTPGVILAYDDDPNYLNRRGAWVEGAGKKAMRQMRTLADYIPVYKIPAIGKEKGDLADLSDDEIYATIEASTSV